MKLQAVFIYICFAIYACDSGLNVPKSDANSQNASAGSAPAGSVSEKQESEVSQSTVDGPKTVPDFFMLLPEKYFTLEGCDREKDKDCKKAREEYLKTFGEVVDLQNGYIKGGCDGGQACMEMAIFKRPDGSYLIGLATFAETLNDYYFLDHNNGVWSDVSSTVPEFSKKNMYELPRHGTTVQVFAKKIIEQGPDFEASEKGRKLYDLIWKDGKFTIKR